MCGRFSMTNETNELITEFVAAGGEPEDWVKSWNIRPTDQIAIAVESKNTGQRKIRSARWSLARPRQPQLRGDYPNFNVRHETVVEKFPYAVRRILVPANGFFEGRNAGGTSTPFYHFSTEHPLLALAGVQSYWVDPSKPRRGDSGFIATVAILTMDAIPRLAEIHPRNPLMIPKDQWDWWLDPKTPSDNSLMGAAAESSKVIAETIQFHQVASPIRGEGKEVASPI